jgi:hypothetical protein
MTIRGLTGFDVSQLLSTTKYERELWPPSAKPLESWDVKSAVRRRIVCGHSSGHGRIIAPRLAGVAVGRTRFRITFSLASILALLYLIHAKVEAERAYL